jgi:hypothetical protein
MKRTTYLIRNRFTGEHVGTWLEPVARARAIDTGLPMLSTEAEDFQYMEGHSISDMGGTSRQLSIRHEEVA